MSGASAVSKYLCRIDQKNEMGGYVKVDMPDLRRSGGDFDHNSTCRLLSGGRGEEAAKIDVGGRRRG